MPRDIKLHLESARVENSPGYGYHIPPLPCDYQLSFRVLFVIATFFVTRLLGLLSEVFRNVVLAYH